MADDDTTGLLIKLALSVFAIIAFVVPEGASTAVGAVALFGLWGEDFAGE